MHNDEEETYDPDPRRHKRKGREPPQLKRWRLTHKGHSYDPRPRHRHSRSQKRNYDPKRSRRSRAGAARRRSYGYGGGGYARGPLGKVEGGLARFGSIIGFLVGFLLPAYSSFKNAQDTQPRWKNLNFGNYVIEGAQHEAKELTGQGKVFPKNPMAYLQFKFFSGDSHWSMPFWISLIAFIVSRLNIVPQRINRILKPVSTGALAATTIGALFQYASPTDGNGTMARGTDGTYQIPLQTASYYT